MMWSFLGERDQDGYKHMCSCFVFWANSSAWPSVISPFDRRPISKAITSSRFFDSTAIFLWCVAHTPEHQIEHTLGQHMFGQNYFGVDLFLTKGILLEMLLIKCSSSPAPCPKVFECCPYPRAPNQTHTGAIYVWSKLALRRPIFEQTYFSNNIFEQQCSVRYTSAPLTPAGCFERITKAFSALE